MARHRFTERWIKARRAAPDERHEYVDAACPGLWLRVSGRDRKVFSVLVQAGGRTRRRTLGRYPAWTLADARAEAMRMQRMVDEGLDPLAPAIPAMLPAPMAPPPAASCSISVEASPAAAQALPLPTPGPTYGDLVDAYNALHLVPNVKSGKNVVKALRHSRLAYLRDCPAAGITRADLVAALDSFMVAGVPGAARNIHRNLKMLFSWAYDRDMIPANPMDRVRPPSRAVERDRVLSNAEIVAVWRAADRMPVPYGAFYRMLFLTGVRRTELAGMRWRELDDETWVIPRERVKKDRAHAVPLVPTALAILATLPRHGPDAFVFTTTAGDRPSCGYSKAKQQIDKLSQTTAWTNHDIRRVTRSKMAELGISREIARKVLNHEDAKVDRIYNRFEYVTEKRQALLRLEEHILALLSTPTDITCELTETLSQAGDVSPS
jgi:integrase